jgi:hypothetical protein
VNTYQLITKGDDEVTAVFSDGNNSVVGPLKAVIEQVIKGLRKSFKNEIIA